MYKGKGPNPAPRELTRSRGVRSKITAVRGPADDGAATVGTPPPAPPRGQLSLHLRKKQHPPPPKEKVNRLGKYMATHTCTLVAHVCTHRGLKTLVLKKIGSHQTHIPQKKIQKEKKSVLPREAEGKSLVAVVELILKLTFSSPFPDSSAESIWIKRV